MRSNGAMGSFFVKKSRTALLPVALGNRSFALDILNSSPDFGMKGLSPRAEHSHRMRQHSENFLSAALADVHACGQRIALVDVLLDCVLE